MGEKWIAGGGASAHMTHSVDLLSYVRLYHDNISDTHLIDVVGYGTLTVLPRGDVTLLNMAYVRDIAFNLFSLMASHG